MDVEVLIIWLIVGAIAGWLAGMVVKGGRLAVVRELHNVAFDHYGLRS
jgi:hypothetical protein